MIKEIKEMAKVDGKIDALLLLLVVAVVVIEPAYIMLSIVGSEPISIGEIIHIVSGVLWLYIIRSGKSAFIGNNVGKICMFLIIARSLSNLLSLMLKILYLN